MKREQIVDKILNILVQKKIIENTTTADLDASLEKNYGINSIELIELIVALEEEFDLEFDDTELELENYESINTIVDTVMNHLVSKGLD